jgi:hypothetical protein
VRGAGDHAPRGADLDRAGDAEVREDRARLFDDDVVRLDVAVDDADPMGRGQRRCQLLDEVDLAAQGPGVAPGRVDVLHHRAQGRPAQELHGDEQLLAVLAEVVDPAHVRVRDPTGQPDLLAQPLPVVGISGQLDVEQLERDGLLELVIEHLEHRAHAADPERADDLVAVGEQVALFERRRVAPCRVDPAHRFAVAPTISHRGTTPGARPLEPAS